MSRSVSNEGNESTTLQIKSGRFASARSFLRRTVTDGTGTRFLSERTYSSGVTLLRRGFVRYEFDPAFAAIPPYDRYDGDRRLQSSRTVFEDDGARYADLDLVNFDGLGHYRQMDTNGTFDSGNIRSSLTNWNPTRGTYPGSFTMVGSTEPWVLTTFNFETATEAGVTSKREFCFEPDTGFLKRVQTLKTGTTRGANDLLVVFSRNSAGQVTQERHFGGDTQSLGTNLCTQGLPANLYRIGYTYQYGVRKTAQYQDAGGTGLSFKSLDLDIDLNTGLAKASRDTSAIKTDFEYDTMGRLRHSKPVAPHDGSERSPCTPRPPQESRRRRTSIAGRTGARRPWRRTRRGWTLSGGSGRSWC